MGHYKSNLRDLEFTCRAVQGAERLGSGLYEQADEETARAALAEMAAFAEGPLAEPYADADRNPPVFDPKTHTVKIPESFKKSYKELYDGEWWRMALPNHLVVSASRRQVQWALAEMAVGSKPSRLHLHGRPELRAHHRCQRHRRAAALGADHDRPCLGRHHGAHRARRGLRRGRRRTKAVKQPDGSWHLDGVKRFITGAAQDDMAENIIHLVLARPEGEGPGTRACRCSSSRTSYSTRTPVSSASTTASYVTNVEHKMGLKASTTCELTFGQHGRPAVGYQVGEIHDGIAQMFQVHRVRPDARRHQGDLHAVHWLSERPGLRQERVQSAT